MKKVFALGAGALLALAIAAPVAADTVVDGNVTEKLIPPSTDAIYDGFVAVCTYPGDKASNWQVFGGGMQCVNGTSPNSPLDEEGNGIPGKLKVLPEDGLVVVQGVNMVYRHVRPSRRNPQGGRLQKEAPIHISNVLPVDEKGERGSRVRFEVERDAKGKVIAKHRLTVSGKRLSELTRKKAE